MEKREHKYRDENWLREQYINCGRTIQSICDEFGVAHQSVERYLKKYGIRKYQINHIPTGEEIRKLYIDNGVGLTDIVNMYPGVGKDTIIKIMNENDIQLRTRSEMSKNWWSKEDNRNKMSEQRLALWQDACYRSKTMEHLTDKESILSRAIKHSASYQGVSVDDWDGFLTKEQTRIRNSDEYAKWRSLVYQRDNYTCQCCGARSKSGSPVILHAHHLEGFSNNKDLRFDINNGITLCRDCHDIRVNGSFHNIYGVRNNTRQQFEEYLKYRKDIINKLDGGDCSG